MGNNSRWKRKAVLGASLALAGIGANAWTIPPQDSLREDIKNVTLAPVHAYVTHDLAAQWSHRVQEADSGQAHSARILLNQRVQPLRERTPERISLATYTQEIGDVLDEVRNNIDWEYVQRRWFSDSIRASSGEQTALAQKLFDQTREQDILATAYAEHVPRIPHVLYSPIQGTSLERGIGNALFEGKLRLLGREYVELMPSRHDELVSFGPWQLTKQAVNGDKDALGGASLMGLALPDSLRLPDTIEYVKGRDNAKAAVLMQLYNTVQLVRSTDERQFNLLNKYANQPQVQLGIQLGHHAPRRAREAVLRLLEQPEYGLTHFADTSLHRHINRLNTYRPR